jgi:aspartate aminotransferase/aminotransferase
MDFSTRSQLIGSASSIEQNELVYKLKREGLDPIILSYGEAPFKIRPLYLAKDSWDRGAHYSEGCGVPELRQEISNYSKKNYLFSSSASQNIMITAGSKIASYYISQLFLNPGDSIVLHEPSWVSYQEHAKLSGASTKFIPFDESITQAYKYLVDDNTKLIYLNNPNNPRGYVYKKEEILELVKVCKKTNTVMVVDESYSDFCINVPFYSAGNLIQDYDNVVVFNSFSKNFSLSGWRLGYIIASNEIIKGLNKFNQHLMTCASTNLQLTLLGNLESIREQIIPQIIELNSKRFQVQKLLNKNKIKYLDGESTFYIFIDYRDKIRNSKEFVLELLEKKQVSIIPGSSYGESTEGFLRMSFGVESLERIEKGISEIIDFLNNK